MRAVRCLLLLACLTAAVPAGAGPQREPIPCPADLAAGVEEACPCDGPDGVELWKSHGRYVRCVARYRTALRRAGCVAAADLREVMRCAARSTCGKPAAVVCCFYDEGTCTDPEPEDGEPAGFCSNDPLRACDADAECLSTRARLMPSEDACYDLDGDALTGSVCSACLIEAP